jgi:MFS family permease
MFAPSFVTGSLIARFGKETIVATGLALFVLSAIVAISGITTAHFWISLVLLGAAWNFAFVGGTAMLTETYRPEEQGKVQGLNDFIVFGLVALASFSSGGVFNVAGWVWLNVGILPIVALMLLAVSLPAGRRRPAN